MRRSLAFPVTAAVCLVVTLTCGRASATVSPVITVTLTLNGAWVHAHQEGGTPPRLTDDELKAFGSALMSCWRISAGSVKAIASQSAEIILQLDKNGARLGPFGLLAPIGDYDAAQTAFVDSARTSLIRCLPFNKLPEAKYERWKTVLVRFSPFEKPAPAQGALKREVYIQSPTWRNVTEEVTVQLGEKLTACWSRNAVQADLDKLPRISMTFELKRDGSVAKEPVLTGNEHLTTDNPPKSPARDEAVKRAAAAIHRCAPYTFLPKATYQHWQSVIATF